MASGQQLSLFSCPIHCISEKHNQGEPQGTGEGLIFYRRCDPLQDLIIDREGSESTEHTVLPQAHHAIMSPKAQGTKYSEAMQELMRNIAQMSWCWLRSCFTQKTDTEGPWRHWSNTGCEHTRPVWEKCPLLWMAQMIHDLVIQTFRGLSQAPTW